MQPRNNRTERGLRFAVLLRRRTGGARSDHEDRFIKRALTIRETCRLQGRNLQRLPAGRDHRSPSRRARAVAAALGTLTS